MSVADDPSVLGPLPASRQSAFASACQDRDAAGVSPSAEIRAPGGRPGAERAYQVYLDPKEDIFRDLKVDREGVRPVSSLRSKYGEPHKELTDPARDIDETISPTR